MEGKVSQEPQQLKGGLVGSGGGYAPGRPSKSGPGLQASGEQGLLGVFSEVSSCRGHRTGEKEGDMAAEKGRNITIGQSISHVSH